MWPCDLKHPVSRTVRNRETAQSVVFCYSSLRSPSHTLKHLCLPLWGWFLTSRSLLSLQKVNLEVEEDWSSRDTPQAKTDTSPWINAQPCIIGGNNSEMCFLRRPSRVKPRCPQTDLLVNANLIGFSPSLPDLGPCPHLCFLGSLSRYTKFTQSLIWCLPLQEPKLSQEVGSAQLA